MGGGGEKKEGGERAGLEGGKNFPFQRTAWLIVNKISGSFQDIFMCVLLVEPVWKVLLDLLDGFSERWC